ncbi:MAG: hypothetical protein J1E00_03495 [Oscillospiraceae bacterium]|nr:hypothetical protein [Oscillospiraceae bacterium]
MRGGMESPVKRDVRLRCPLFLFDRETAGELEPLLEALLRDLRGSGYVPLSLRELFRCRRGLRPWPPRPCVILFRDLPFAALQRVLSLLERWETPAGLFCSAPYGVEETEALCSSRWLQVYGDAHGADAMPPELRGFHVAAFCERIDPCAEAFLREKRIWMAVTPAENASPRTGRVPGGVDLLYALSVRRGNRLPELLARWHQALTAREETPEIGMRLEESKPRSVTVILPISDRVSVADLPLAAYLSVLGDAPDVDWETAYDPSDGSYRLFPSLKALEEQPMAEAVPEAFLRALEEGSYLLLRPRDGSAGGLLLFGYDGEREVFLGKIARFGRLERADLRFSAPEIPWGAFTAVRLTPRRTKDPASRGEAMLRTQDTRQGEGTAVAFANRVFGGVSVSAESLRAFLAERMLCASRFLALCGRENLYAEPAERYLALLEREGSPLLLALQGKETPAEDDLSWLGVLLQRLLNAERGCRQGLAEELERMRALRAFQREKPAK